MTNWKDVATARIIDICEGVVDESTALEAVTLAAYMLAYGEEENCSEKMYKIGAMSGLLKKMYKSDGGTLISYIQAAIEALNQMKEEIMGDVKNDNGKGD